MIDLLRQTRFGQKSKNWLEKFALIIPLKPNQITIAAIFLAILGFLAIYSNQLLLGFSLFLISGFFDAIDGAVARVKNQKTKLGFFLDGVSDRIVEFLIILSFLFLPFPGIPKEFLLFTLLFFSLTIPYLKAYAEHSGNLTHEEALRMGGIFERSERLILFYLILVSSILGFGSISSLLLSVSIFLAFITFIQRFYYVVKH
jgi:archaetidylinositol phosphate synthase